ncbi:putative reverse transcriptase domain-containing protein [Tanacetum coccineum]
MNSDQFFFDDTDEEEEVNNRHGTHDRLVAAYFAEQPIYTPKQFRERFRLRRKLFNRIVQDLNDAYPYFQQNIDAVGRCGISSLVKCTSTIPQLAYDSSPDSLDEYLQIGTKTARDCLEKHGFPSMVGSIDCTKWPWSQCPVGLLGQFWSNNDINVIRQSPFLNDLKEGKAPKVAFVANDALLIRKRIRYKQAHKAARKDVERAFDVLKKKWVIIKTPARKKAISPKFFREEQHREDDPIRSEENRLQVIRDINDSNADLSLKADLESKKSSHKPKAEDTNQKKLYLLHMDLSGPMRVESINGKKYILVIVDDYSSNYGVLGEYYQKARILELKQRYFEDYYSDYQYALSIKEDTAYPCLHSPKTAKETCSICLKRLKRSRIPLVKVRWNSKRGPEFTWEREDQFKKKYPHLFTKTAPSSSAASLASEDFADLICDILDIRSLKEINSVMLDSDESGVTYMEVSSPFEDLSNIRSPRAYDHEYLELPGMPEDPYVEAALQVPPSPDYMPGLEEPEQAPPSPDYSLDYVPESDPEADPEEDDDEDPEEDPVDGGDDGDDEEGSSEDDEDDDMDIEADDKEEEEEHSAPADSVSAATPPPYPAYRVTSRISIPAPVPTQVWSDAEVARLLAISTPPSSPLFLWSSPLPHIPSPSLPLSPPSFMLSPAPPPSLIRSLGYRVAMIRLRAEAASTSHSLPLPPPFILSPNKSDAPSPGIPPPLPISVSTSSPPLLLPCASRWKDRPEVTLPPQKRLGIALGPYNTSCFRSLYDIM